MIKKFVLNGLLLLFLSNCGYVPIYSKTNQDFQINSIQTLGEKKINKLLYNKFKVYKDNPSAKKTFDLNINSTSAKMTIAKNKKGNPTQFSIKVSVSLQVTDDVNNKIDRIFSENSTYNNNDNKFDLKKYENNLIKNMTEKIFSEIILFIRTGGLLWF